MNNEQGAMNNGRGEAIELIAHCSLLIANFPVPWTPTPVPF